MTKKELLLDYLVNDFKEDIAKLIYIIGRFNVTPEACVSAILSFINADCENFKCKLTEIVEAE